jgi:MOSC domain-containing protein YiiM
VSVTKNELTSAPLDASARESKRVPNGIVAAVSASAAHTFSKPTQARIRLQQGIGVEGDAHAGATVKHRSRVRKDPTQPNLRQVHLIHAELHDELNAAGFRASAGDMGENITTRGIHLLALPRGTRLHIGASAVVEITGLRNPCAQLDDFQLGLMNAVLARDADGNLIRKGGIMGIVLASGEIAPGDVIRVELPPEPHTPLQVV